MRGLWKRFICAISIHHVRVMGFDGCSVEGFCDWCNRDVLQDSQGGWFPIEKKR